MNKVVYFVHILICIVINVCNYVIIYVPTTLTIAIKLFTN